MEDRHVHPPSLALGALSTVSSLVGAAASNLAEAGQNDLLAALARRSQAKNRRKSRQAASRLPLDTGTLAALIALQGQGGVGHAGLFGKLDTDGDGVISKSEHAAFTLLGANGDGVRHAFAKASVGDLSLWER